MLRQKQKIIICKYLYYTSTKNIKEFNWVFRNAKEKMYILCDCKNYIKCK